MLILDVKGNYYKQVLNFAIEAGREVRLIVKPELTKEDKAANRRTEISCFCYEE